MKTKLYIASPLFNEAERSFNLFLARELEFFFDTYLPQRDGGLLPDLIKSGATQEKASEQVFSADVRALVDCDVVLAILDGLCVDEGVAFELGYAFAIGKNCYGFHTDSRQKLSRFSNPMVYTPLSRIFSTIEELVGWAQTYSLAKNPDLKVMNSIKLNIMPDKRQLI